MTTPSINAPYAIIQDAMEDAKLLQEGDTPNSDQYAKYMRRLRDVINFLQTGGLKLWLNVDTAVNLVASQATYTFKPSGDVDMTKPLRVMQGYILDAVSNSRRPIYPLAWSDYLQLSSPTNLGAINSYFVNKQATQLSVTFWNTPDATEAANEAHVLLQVQVTNPLNLTTTMDFPEEWRMALRWGLAADICTGQPQAVIDRCEGKASLYKAALEDFDVEDASTSFAPDSRGQYAGSAFR